MAGGGIHPNHQQRPPVGLPSPSAAVSSAAPPHPPPVHHHHHPPVLVDNHNRNSPYDEVSTLVSFHLMVGGRIHPNHQQRPPVGSPSPSAAVSSAASPHPPPVHHLHPPPVLVDNHNRSPYDESRTIFIAGLPDDVKERELLNLLRWLPGYEASQVNFKGEKPMGFALFSTAQFAETAKDTLQHLVFDAESGSVIYTEMAKKNLLVKRVGDSNASDQNKRQRTGGDCTHSVYSPSPFHSPPPPVSGQPHWYMAPASPPYDPHAGYDALLAPMPAPTPSSNVPVENINDNPPCNNTLNFLEGINEEELMDLLSGYMESPPYDPHAGYDASPAPMPAPAPSSNVPVQNINDNPPCNTLFIDNLEEDIDEEELMNLLSGQPGFKQMKILRETVCFTEFEDVNSATNAHHNLQGAIIPSSSSFGILRIQYSNNPFGKREQGGGYSFSPSHIANALKDACHISGP